MAYVFGKLERKSLKEDLIPLAILLAVPFVVVTMMFDGGNDTITELMSVGSVGAALTLLLVFVYARINPRSFQRIFQPAAFERCLSMDKSVWQNLEQLGDSYYVFNNFIFELCGVEHLVISPNGIFVISKITREGRLRVKSDVLFAGDSPLETLTGNTWRVCHLINIILKKWFKIDYMPQPVLVACADNASVITNYDSMAIVAPTELNALIAEGSRELDTETAYGFANFVRDRYVRKNNDIRKAAGAKLQPAMILIPLAWVVFLGGQSFAQGTISMVHLAIGGLCCQLVARDSRWGRLFCGAYNVLLVISIYYQGSADKVWSALDIVSGLCFVIATIALFLPSNLAPKDRNRSIIAL